MLKPTQNTGITVEISLVNCLKRGALLKKEVEQLVVEAKRLGLDLDEVTNAVIRHWSRLEGAPALATTRRRE